MRLHYPLQFTREKARLSLSGFPHPIFTQWIFNSTYISRVVGHLITQVTKKNLLYVSKKNLRYERKYLHWMSLLTSDVQNNPHGKTRVSYSTQALGNLRSYKMCNIVANCWAHLLSTFTYYGRTTHSRPLKQFCICSGAVKGNLNLQLCRKIEMIGIAKFSCFFS